MGTLTTTWSRWTAAHFDDHQGLERFIAAAPTMRADLEYAPMESSPTSLWLRWRPPALIAARDLVRANGGRMVFTVTRQGG